jgi:hypothetical protein
MVTPAVTTWPRGWRLCALGGVLCLPFLYGAAIDESFDVGGGGGQYVFGLRGTISQVRHGEGFVRVRKEVATHVSFDGTAGIAIVETRELHSRDNPPSLDKVTGEESTFVRPTVAWQASGWGLQVGALIVSERTDRTILPVFKLQVGPPVLHVLADNGLGGFAGSLFEGNFAPVPLPWYAGFAVEFDSRFWHSQEGTEDGTELRLTARHLLQTFELGVRVHRERMRFFAEAVWRPRPVAEVNHGPGPFTELAFTAGVGWEFGLGPRRERVPGPPSEMRFRPAPEAER